MSASAAIQLVRRVGENGSTVPTRISATPASAGRAGDLLRALTVAKPGIILVELQAALIERGLADYAG